MTAKEFVKSKAPRAKAERRMHYGVTKSLKKYYLITDSGKTIASGITESAAWMNAKGYIMEIEAKTDENKSK